MPIVTEEKNATATGAAFYWFGMLPADKPVQWAIPTEMRDEGTGEFYKLASFSAFDLWSMRASFQRGASRFPIFISKLRPQTSLAVRGMIFPAHSSEAAWNGEQISQIAFPGSGVVMERPQFDAIIKSCYRHFVRFPSGVDRADDHDANCEMWDMDLGSKPKHFTPEQWDQYRVMHSVDECPTFNPRTDKYVAEYVYCVKVDGVQWQGWPDREYRFNPNSFHRQVVPNMNRDFFTKPPRSVAEMYPQRS